jgi:threonine synthase
MPLFQGDTQDIISMNIRKLISEGYSPEQATAIAYAEAEKYRAKRRR